MIESPVWTPIRIKVLDGADNNAVVGRIADDFQFKHFPSDDSLFHQHFADGAGFQTAL